MKCFNCGCDIVNTEVGSCTNCSAILNATKINFISYIGAPDSLAGYQKSYKLVLLKYIIEAILCDSEASVAEIIPSIKAFYLNRKSEGLTSDYDVDPRIAEIENSSDYDVFAVIKSQPFKVINEKGYLFLNHNANDKLVFVFNDDITNSMSKDEWKKLLNIIEEKLKLYYERYDGVNNASAPKNQIPSKQIENVLTDTSKTDIDISVLEIANLSVRAKNILMRNKLYTIESVLNFIQDNDLRTLKNMGEKTYEEIISLVQSANYQLVKSLDPNSIASLFADNKYHLFVEFCCENGFSTIEDLEGFDFDLLLNEPGFGVGKLNAIKEKYNRLLNRDMNPQNDIGTIKNDGNTQPIIIIDPSNTELSISCLRFARISTQSATKFYETGFCKIGDLGNITLGKLIQMFGRSKAAETLEKIQVFENSLLWIATNTLEEYKNTREFDIYIDRANKKTLQEIANNYGITRERVRQIESKFFRLFSPLFGSLVEQHMKENNLSYITTQDVLDFFDDDAFDSVIMYTLKVSYSLEYLPFADMFIRKLDEAQDTEAKLRRLTQELIGDDGINFFESLPQIEEMLNTSDLGFISADAFLNYLIEIGAYFYGDLVFLRKQPYSKLCLLLIAKHFKNGISLSSDDDMNLLRTLFHSEYGEYELPERNHAIGARLADSLILCDRGKAKLIENINFDQNVIEDIKRYIDESPLKTLYFSEIYNEFEGVLSFTSDITNYHGLHGLLSYLYRDEYEFSRDTLTKKNVKGTSLNISDRIIMFMSEKGRAVTRNEIKQKIGGLTDIMLFNAISNSDKLLQWDYNSFNTLENLSIVPDDKMILSEILEDIFSQFKGYSSDRLIYEKLKVQYPEFLLKNGIENATNLFYILQKLLNDKYQFSRPHICENGIVDALTTKTIALYLLGTTNQISRSAFVQIAKNVYWSETTADLIFYELENDYIRISDDIYILSNDFNIEKEALNQISIWIHGYIAEHDYLSMIGFEDFSDFPSIPYEWNSFLLISIIKKYHLGMKLISPAIKDRRYNKEIIVVENSKQTKLDDIVYDLLIKNNINFIDESNLLSFLVINHLISKVIPKEIFDSKCLNYADGYFKIA